MDWEMALVINFIGIVEWMFLMFMLNSIDKRSKDQDN